MGKGVVIGVGVAAVAVAGAAVMSHVITKKLLHVALHRDGLSPRIVKHQGKLMGSEDNVALLEKVNAYGKWLKEQEHDEVEITSYDGIRHVGHLWECESPQRTVLLMHGWRSSWANDFGVMADFLHKNHCNILFAEQRAQNKSGGEYMGFGLLERYDCREWIKWLNERYGTDTPLYLGGVSMGATTVLMASGLGLPENVRGIIADCGFTSPYAIWKHVVQKNLRLPYELHARAADDLCKRRIQHTPREYCTTMALKNTNIPILFVHGTDDHFVPITMTYENYKACASPKRLLVVPGAEHAASYLIDTERYEKAILEFWNDFDERK